MGGERFGYVVEGVGFDFVEVVLVFVVCVVLVFDFVIHCSIGTTAAGGGALLVIG